MLINDAMLDRMRIGSVIVDLAVGQGGNCANTKPGETINRKGVSLIGASELPRTIPNHASTLYSRNLIALLEPLINEGSITLNIEDELINGALISHNGSIRFKGLITNGGIN